MYRIFEQRRLRRICAYAQIRQSLRGSHTQRMDADAYSDQNLGFRPSWLRHHVRENGAFAHLRYVRKSRVLVHIRVYNG